MQNKPVGRSGLAVLSAALVCACAAAFAHAAERPALTLALPAPKLAPPPGTSPVNVLTVDGFFYETSAGRTPLPTTLAVRPLDAAGQRLEGHARLADGRKVAVSAQRTGDEFTLRLGAEPADGILRWGLSIQALDKEYFTGLMERVVDGPQGASWAPGITAAMDLRGQTVDMIVKPTTSVYAPFYLSSRGYAAFVKGDWPGRFDFCATDTKRVQIAFEGPSLEVKIYTASDPAALVRALDAGPPFLPPKWMFTPWRWRDEHKQRTAYYDGTPVTGPFNAEVMEDMLMMKAFGIPCGIYWIDRPYGPGRLGYDDFDIDAARLPNFGEMVKWLNEQDARLLMWIGPFFQGRMEQEGLAKGYTLAGQKPLPNNYPMVDLTNPAARAYWQDGVAKLLRLGVAGFKLDRAEEDIPEEGPFRVFDGRSIRENRNAYPAIVSPIWEKGQRQQQVYLPRGAKWQDAWRPEKTYDGGQTIAVEAALHQIPLFVRVGSGLELGDLDKEYAEARAIAEKRPDLKALDADVRRWFEARPAGGGQ